MYQLSLTPYFPPRKGITVLKQFVSVVEADEIVNYIIVTCNSLDLTGMLLQVLQWKSLCQLSCYEMFT